MSEVQQITKANFIRLGVAAFKEHELREIVATFCKLPGIAPLAASQGSAGGERGGVRSEDTAKVAADLQELMDVIEAVRGERGLLRVSGTRGDPNDVGVLGIERFNDLMIRAIDALAIPTLAQTVKVPVDAIINLVNYQQQCDEDGAMVQVFRQALCEVLAYVTEVRPDNKWASEAPSAEPCAFCGSTYAHCLTAGSATYCRTSSVASADYQTTTNGDQNA